jgi:hypothetical protein
MLAYPETFSLLVLKRFAYYFIIEWKKGKPGFA